NPTAAALLRLVLLLQGRVRVASTALRAPPAAEGRACRAARRVRSRGADPVVHDDGAASRRRLHALEGQSAPGAAAAARDRARRERAGRLPDDAAHLPGHDPALVVRRPALAPGPGGP